MFYMNKLLLYIGTVKILDRFVHCDYLDNGAYFT